MTVDEIRALFDFNHWANARTLDACAALSTEGFVRPNGSSFPSVRDTLAHIHGAEWVWLERWQGRFPKMPAARESDDLETIRARWNETGTALADFAQSRSQADLDAIHEIRTFDGTPYRHPLWQMMQHVVNHGSYHRGQIAAFLRQAGHQAQATDLIRYYREAQSASLSL
jgi:uncharacterized damage-inducible protein DinB